MTETLHPLARVPASIEVDDRPHVLRIVIPASQWRPPMWTFLVLALVASVSVWAEMVGPFMMMGMIAVPLALLVLRQTLRPNEERLEVRVSHQIVGVGAEEFGLAGLAASISKGQLVLRVPTAGRVDERRLGGFGTRTELCWLLDVIEFARREQLLGGGAWRGSSRGSTNVPGGAAKTVTWTPEQDQARAEADQIHTLHLSALGDETSAESHPKVSRTVWSDRYEDLGLLGTGGMGEVRRVRDRELNRTLAMKVIQPALMNRPTSYARFVEEAQVSAQLQHPGIVPIHDFGKHPDGRVWFTMKEVKGRTLGDVIREFHGTSPTRWTFRRLIDALRRVTEAVAFAHAKGVVHRDLKPDNVMVGDHGEVLVLDWGLAKVLGNRDWSMTLPDVRGDGSPEAEADEGPPEDPVIVTERTSDDAFATRMGQVAGTPAYMPPEQARGEIDRIDTRSDVYALGALLYEVLSGEPPYQGEDGPQVLAQVILGPPASVAGPPRSRQVQMGEVRTQLPSELVEACERAMSRKPEDRYPSASELAEDLVEWLDGARRRDQAMEVLQKALSRAPVAADLRARARHKDEEARALLDLVEPWEPESRKAPGWAKQDEAARLRRQADHADFSVGQGLQAALRVAPDLIEAHVALTARYQTQHAAAEAVRDADAQARAEILMRLHAESLPESHSTRRECATYLEGHGALTLVTDPPGAEVLLHRYEEHNRRLVEGPVRSLGQTPLENVSIPMGSYLAVLRHPDCQEVRYPVEVPRLGHWDGIAPGACEPTPIWLPPTGYLGSDEVYVPTGWFRSGGDPSAKISLPRRRLWCDALVMHRFSVTNRQYLMFLDDLVVQGRQNEALRHAPRERPGAANEEGALVYHFDGSRFSLQVDADGDAWQEEWPVLQVDWYGAGAYLDWLAERSGRPWRLPDEREWEKAARGVDGRWFPWGDHFDPSWCHTNQSHRSRRLPAVVDSYPEDVSPTGVRGLGGNTEDWCLNHFDPAPVFAGPVVTPPQDPPALCTDTLTVVRGGAWFITATSARSADRGRVEPNGRYSFLGFRGVYRPRLG